MRRTNNGRQQARTVLVILSCFLLLTLSALSIHTIAQNHSAQNGEGGSEEEFLWKELGSKVYSRSCAACHQQDGEGIPGAFPPLADNAFVQSQPSEVIRTIYNGRGGMPSFSGDLSNEELAAVISYIRNTWGNEAEPTEPDDVRAVLEGAFLFSVQEGVSSIVAALNENQLPDALRQAFNEEGVSISEDVTVEKSDNNEWTIDQRYKARQFAEQLNIYELLDS